MALGVVLSPGDGHKVVAQAAAAQSALEGGFIPDLLHRQHIGVEHAQALPQPGELALELCGAVGLLVFIEHAPGVGQVQHIAGGHHQGGQGLGRVVGAHGAK